MVEEKFVELSSLVCEPARARMLWNLLDGKAYTASELAIAAEISSTSASNHLTKLLEANLLKVDSQGRHRYFSFATPEVAYAIESLANLASHQLPANVKQVAAQSGIRYCRTCYDHLAGYVGVKLAEELTSRKIITVSERAYDITAKGWKWFADFNISKEEIVSKRRPVSRQCLDWSERRPHLAGQIGALLLTKMLEKNWFRKVQFSRELVVTSKGQKELYNLLGIEV
jgi:DNA-binding transcriptional ArsR family regulator